MRLTAQTKQRMQLLPQLISLRTTKWTQPGGVVVYYWRWWRCASIAPGRWWETYAILDDRSERTILYFFTAPHSSWAPGTERRPGPLNHLGIQSAFYWSVPACGQALADGHPALPEWEAHNPVKAGYRSCQNAKGEDGQSGCRWCPSLRHFPTSRLWMDYSPLLNVTMEGSSGPSVWDRESAMSRFSKSRVIQWWE